MDNKNLRGLSEAYNEVYLGEVNLPFGFKPGEAQAIYNKGKGERATNQRAQLGVVKTNKGFTVKPGSNVYNPDAYSQGLQLAQRLNKETGLGKPKPASTTKPSTGLPPRPAAAPASRPAAAPASRPAAAPASRPSNSSPANLPTSQKIQSGMQVYNAQRSAGDMKGATSTGMGVNQMKYGANFAKPKTPNPLMQKTFGYQTGNSPSDQQSRASAIVSSGQVAALKPATPIAAAVKPATPTPQKRNQAPSRAPITQMNSYDFGKPDRITQDVASLYHSIYEAKKKVDQDQDGDNDFADVRIARMVASGMSLKDAIAAVRNKSYNEETELGEATAMSKRGLNEPAIRRRIAKSTGGGESADRATTLAGKQTYGQRGVNPQARENLARAQRRNFRKTTSSSPGLHGYAYTSNDSDVKAKQAARGAQRSALTPAEKKKLNMEYFELWVNELLDEGYDLSDYTWNELYENYQELDEKAVSWDTGRNSKGQTPRDTATRRQATLQTSSNPANQVRASQIGQVRGNMRAAITATPPAKLQSAGPIASQRFKNAAIRQRGGSPDSSKIPTVPGLKAANQDAQRRLKPSGPTGVRYGSAGIGLADSYELYNLVIGHLLDEGFADDYDSANMMIERMSDEWLEAIVESIN